MDIGPGSVSNIVFNNNRHIFYNYEHWNIKEAYKAFSPSMEIYEDEEFLGTCSNRIWILDENNHDFNLLLKNNDYAIIDEKKFDTPYQNNKYNIILAEKVKKSAFFNYER